jgi:hypothetical protein
MNCNVRIAILLMEGGTGKSERHLSLCCRRIKLIVALFASLFWRWSQNGGDDRHGSNTESYEVFEGEQRSAAKHLDMQEVRY